MLKLPSKRSKKWFLVFLLTIVINAVLMILGYVIANLVKGGNPFNGAMFVILFFACILLLIFAVIGFFGGKHTFFYSNLALAFGSFLAGAYITEDFAGWEYLSSVLMLFLYTGIGLITGIIFDFFYRKKDYSNLVEKSSVKINKIFIAIISILLFLPIFEFFFID
ncbi:MAG: hypothetical protein ACLFPS_07525 [Clostridia bacterium]